MTDKGFIFNIIWGFTLGILVAGGFTLHSLFQILFFASAMIICHWVLSYLEEK